MASTDHAFFYNSDNGDRVYDADSFEHLLKKFFTTGVFQGSCKGSAPGTGMTIRMGTGYCNIDGKVRFFSEQQEFLLQNAHATYDRIDTLVIERNDVDRDITAKVVTGSYSSSPRATAPVRSGGIYQLVVAEIYVAGGVVRITNSNVTDKRPDTSVCGYVLSAVQTPDFSELYAQFESQADDVISEYTGQFDHWYQVSTADFQEWFEEIRGQLDEDQAGHLQNEVDTLAGDISNAYDDSATYSVGNYCIRGNVLYKCIVPITSPESWTAAHWQAVNISDELAAEKSERAAADASQSQAIANVEDGLAIVANGNTHAAVASGQFVYVKNHSTLADGLYRATAAIATNGALSTSNLAADASGGLNALKASVDSLNSKITTVSNGWASVNSGFSSQISRDSIKFIKRADGVCMVFGEFDVSSDISAVARTPIFEGFPRTSFTYPANTVWTSVVNASTNKSYRIAFGPSNGTLDEFYTAIPSGNYQLNAFTYLT